MKECMHEGTNWTWIKNYRGVQYVHKCIMVRVGGNENHVKYAKNTLIQQNQREIYDSMGQIINFQK